MPDRRLGLAGPLAIHPRAFTAPSGPWVPSHAGLCPSCFWHFYLLCPKALGSSDLRMSSCVPKGRGKRRGLGPTLCTSPLPPPARSPGEQDSEALAVGNCWEHPRPSFGLPAELWRLDFSVARETSVFPGKKTTVLWLLRHPPPLSQK